MKNVGVQFPHLRTQVEVASFPSQRVLDVGWLCKDIHGETNPKLVGRNTTNINNKYMSMPPYTLCIEYIASKSEIKLLVTSFLFGISGCSRVWGSHVCGRSWLSINVRKAELPNATLVRTDRIVRRHTQNFLWKLTNLLQPIIGKW